MSWVAVGVGGAGIAASFIPRGGKKGGGGLGLGELPQWQADPNVAWSQDRLKGQADYLINGLTTQGGSLAGMLGDTVNLNPETSRLATERYVSAQEPVYRRGLQDITNTLEANNQLTGSTTASSLGNFQADYMAGLTSANANQALADIDRALANRVSLYGTGLNTTSTVGTNALTNQAQMNQFALSNYENQVAGALASQPPATGGFSGALTGAIGGGLAGLATGNPYIAGAGALAGGISGYSGTPSTGGNFLTSGASLYGSSKQTNPFAGLTSSNVSSVGSGSSISGGLASYIPSSLSGTNLSKYAY